MSIPKNWFSFDFKGKNYLVNLDGEKLTCKRIHEFGSAVYVSKINVRDEKILYFATKLHARYEKNSSPVGTHYSLKEIEEDGFVRCGIAEYKGLIELRNRENLKNTFSNTVLKWWLGLVFCVLTGLASIVLISQSYAISTWNAFDGDMITNVLFFVLSTVFEIYLFSKDKSWTNLLLLSVSPACLVTAVLASVYEDRAKYVCMAITGIYIAFLVAYGLWKSVKRVRKRTNFAKIALSYVLLCAVMCEVVLVSTASCIKTVKPEDAATIKSDYLEALCSITEEQWQEYTLEQKKDVLEVICDYECEINLGYPSPELKISELNEYTNGNYYHKDRLITLNSLCVGEKSVREVIETLLHEIRHGYQHELVNMYKRVSRILTEEEKKLQPFRMAGEFSENSGHYVSVAEDVYGYLDQSVEVDSRAWAAERINFYIPYIEYKESEDTEESAE